MNEQCPICEATLDDDGHCPCCVQARSKGYAPGSFAACLDFQFSSDRSEQLATSDEPRFTRAF